MEAHLSHIFFGEVLEKGMKAPLSTALQCKFFLHNGISIILPTWGKKAVATNILSSMLPHCKTKGARVEIEGSLLF